MRWLVEVSRVGDTAASERYCIEAKRWQAALQEARRLRGDSGALPKLTIELLDQGYRAVDPALKVRYVVTEAPPGLPLTEGAQALLTTYPPPPAGQSQAPAAAPSASVPPPAPASSRAATPSYTPVPALSSSLPPATLASPRPSAGPLTTQVIRQREERPTATNPIEYREIAFAVRPGGTQAELAALLNARFEEVRSGLSGDYKRYVQLAIFDHVFVKRPVRPPLATLVWKDWRGDAVLQFPGFGEDKRVASEPPPSSALSTRAPSWVGAPGPVSMAPLGPLPENLGGASAAPPRPASVIPARVVSVGPSAPPSEPIAPAAVVSVASREPVREPAAVSRQTLPSAPPTAPPPSIQVGEAETVSLPAESSSVPVPAPALSSDSAAAQVERVAAAVNRAEAGGSDPALPLTRRSEPAAARRSDPAAPRRSEPTAARRRSASEDLIGDLFESIHELAFMVDLVSGADFVVHALYDVIPCEAIVVHAFDLGRREFVVVRARGPDARNALLHRTPDADPVVREVMRRRSLISNGASPARTGAFEKLGTAPQLLLSAGVRQGGRYLGLIELANPVGGTPFHEGEASALEYVCEQFAEFVASRPVVLDEDVILGR
jgi:hypothetical protein